MPVEQQLVTEKHVLNQNLPGIVAADTTPPPAAAVGNRWTDVWKFQIPTGFTYVFSPEDKFSAYLQLVQGEVEALADDGGSFTIETTEATEDTGDDMTLMPATEAINDAYYFGNPYKFRALTIDITTQGVGTAVAWEYWNGSAWTAIPNITDGTTGLTAAVGERTVSFEPHPDWASTVVNGTYGDWIRVRVTTASFTTVPLAGEAWIHRTGTQIGNQDLVRVIVQDPSTAEGQYRLVGPVFYRRVTEFQEDQKLYRPDLSTPMAVREGTWVIIQVDTLAPVDVSESYFQLTASRARKGLG